MKISIIGLSSISLYFYLKLFEAGHSCVVVSKSVGNTSCRHRTYFRYFNEQDGGHGSIDIFFSANLKNGSDCIVVSTTATNIGYYLKNTQLAEISKTVPCLFFQNGIDAYRQERENTSLQGLRKIVCSVNGLSTRREEQDLLYIKDRMPSISYFSDSNWSSECQERISQILTVTSGGRLARKQSISKVVFPKLIKTGPHVVVSAFQMLRNHENAKYCPSDLQQVLTDVFTEYCNIGKRCGGIDDKDVQEAAKILKSLLSERIINSIARRLVLFGVIGSEFHEAVLDVVSLSASIGCRADATALYSQMILDCIQ